MYVLLYILLCAAHAIAALQSPDAVCNNRHITVVSGEQAGAPMAPAPQVPGGPATQVPVFTATPQPTSVRGKRKQPSEIAKEEDDVFIKRSTELKERIRGLLELIEKNRGDKEKRAELQEVFSLFFKSFYFIKFV